MKLHSVGRPMLANSAIRKATASPGAGVAMPPKSGSRAIRGAVPVAGQQEERAGGEAVRNHLIHRAVGALLAESEDAEHDEAEVADGRVGDQALDVRLDQSDQRAVDDTDDGEHGNPARTAVRAAG